MTEADSNKSHSQANSNDVVSDKDTTRKAEKRAQYLAKREYYLERAKARYLENPEKAKEARRAYRKANPEKVAAQNLAWRLANYEKEKARRRKVRMENREKISAQKRAWRLANLEKQKEQDRASRIRNLEKRKKSNQAWRAANGEWRREYIRAKYKTDIQFKLAMGLRNRLRNALNAQNAEKCTKAVRLLGCSIQQFKEHLEAQFTKKMTWQNHGTYWHIDHIIPISSFDLKDDAQASVACHYTNLRPMKASANMAKGAKITEPQMSLLLPAA
jgi:hypothetical protein